MNDLTWFKSSYSDSGGGECVEVAWAKSSYSDSGGGDCVEVAVSPATTAVHIRDSKDRGGPVLSIGPAAWDAFLTFASIEA